MSSLISHFLNRWRNNTGTEVPPLIEYSPAPGTAIRYSPNLVEELKEDHREFFDLQRAVVSALHTGHMETIPALLQRFDSLLTAHLLTEQVRLYAYMDAYFANDRHTREMLREYRVEMDRIGSSVRKMIKKYRALATDRHLHHDIEADMEELRQVLDERMNREEVTLYPLYMPVSN